MKTLIAYFSASGVTAGKAKTAAEILDADLFEIRPKKKYSGQDLDWMNKRSRSTLEMQDPDCRPELVEPAPDLRPYDTVVIGFPIWWYTAPRIIYTFLESGDFSGKKIYVFATSGGSGVEKAFRDLSRQFPSYDFVRGSLLNGRVDAGTIRAFVK